MAYVDVEYPDGSGSLVINYPESSHSFDVYNVPNVTIIGGVGGDALAAHINDPEPHRAYDVDLQDLSTLFENGLF